MYEPDNVLDHTSFQELLTDAVNVYLSPDLKFSCPFEYVFDSVE
jgi:hypothetical protein